jgi:hypothetical protein
MRRLAEWADDLDVDAARGAGGGRALPAQAGIVPYVGLRQPERGPHEVVDAGPGKGDGVRLWLAVFGYRVVADPDVDP